MQYTNTSIIHIVWLCEGEESIVSVEQRPKRAELRTKKRSARRCNKNWNRLSCCCFSNAYNKKERKCPYCADLNTSCPHVLYGLMLMPKYGAMVVHEMSYQAVSWTGRLGQIERLFLQPPKKEVDCSWLHITGKEADIIRFMLWTSDMIYYFSKEILYV